MNYKSLKKFGFSFIFLALIAPTLDALIVKLSDLHTMAKRSDIVIHGYIGEQKVVMDKLGRPTTLSQIEVIDGLYGAKTGEVITVYQVGGKLDGLVAPIIGGQRFNVGHEVIFFGLKVGNNYVNYGGGQGKLDIVIEQGVEIVKEDLGDAMTIGGHNMNPIHPMPETFPSKSMIKDEIRLMLKSR